MLTLLEDILMIYNVSKMSHHSEKAYSNLEYSEQTEEDGSINYLGAKMYRKQGRLHMEAFDKTLEWTFPVIRYPHAISNQLSGIYMGQLQLYM
jgi:predicted aldo/keto reductase-like oxidoreductase